MKIVFFDDQRLGGRVNTNRVYGDAEFMSEYTSDQACPALPAVFKDGTIAPYVMYYTTYHLLEEKDGKRQKMHCFCMAVSDDCVHWKPYPNDLEFENKFKPHQILPADECVEVMAVIRDNDGVYRFFACYVDWSTLTLSSKAFASKDGVFLYEDGSKAIQGGEPFTGLFYNHKKDCYTFIIRPNWAERRCCIAETKDFKTYTPLRVIMQTDSMDRAMTEIYGMPTFNMGDYFVGLVNLYDATIFSTRQKFEKGHMSVQLAYSFDGEHFQRSLRQPFIHRGSPNSPYYGMVMPYSITEREDDLVITAGVSHYEHGFFSGVDNPGHIASFRLKKDRFIGLESDGGDGIVCTRMLLWYGGELSVNIEVPYGEAKARILDEQANEIKGFGLEESIPFTGDSLSWTPQWKNAKLDDLKGTHFLVEIQYYNGILYAIEGNFEILMTTMQARKTLILGKPVPPLLY